VRNAAWLALLFVVLACAGGCALAPHVQGLSWIDRFRAPAPPDPNTIVIETALIERPLGDSYLCRELWQDTDELVVGLERRESLNENGLRVGQLVGTPPAGFQTLLMSPRYCSEPKRLIVPSGTLLPKHVSPILPHASLDVMLETGKTELEVDQARFGFDVTPTLTADGRTRLVFTPKVETRENLLPFQASPEQSRWMLRIERPSRQFPDLSWEVTLAPGQYLVVGCRPEKSASFGQYAFVQEDTAIPVQRLLVIRTNRATTPGNDLAGDEMLRTSSSPPLAVQAATPTIRGKAR
jgi:hypothetical protein